MNVIRTSVPVWKCGKCEKPYHLQLSAESCCVKKHCVDCGCELDVNWYRTTCSTCSEKRRFNQAQKMTPEEYCKKYTGNMVVLDDKYYRDIEEALEEWSDCKHPQTPTIGEFPSYLWGTTKEFVRIDADYALENATDDAFEDAEFGHEAEKQFIEMVEKWNSENQIVYYVETDIAIIVPDEMKREIMVDDQTIEKG